MSNLLERVKTLRVEANNAEIDFLREAGWNHTCPVPRCPWMWEKKLPDGRTIIADKEMAVRIQEEEDTGPGEQP